MCVDNEFQRPKEENFKSCVFSVPVQTELSGSSSCLHTAFPTIRSQSLEKPSPILFPWEHGTSLQKAIPTHADIFLVEVFNTE